MMEYDLLSISSTPKEFSKAGLQERYARKLVLERRLENANSKPGFDAFSLNIDGRAAASPHLTPAVDDNDSCSLVRDNKSQAAGERARQRPSCVLQPCNLACRVQYSALR